MADITGAVLAAKVVIDDAGARKQLDDMQDKAAQAQSGISGLLGKIGSFAGAALAVSGINLGLSGLFQGISSIIGQDEGIENTTANLTRLLGSVSAAQQAIADMKQFAANTPLSFNDIADATQQLLGFGYQLQQTQPLIQAIGDALGANLTPASLMQVVQVFGQMHAGATLQTQDLRQLQSVGINAFQVLADQMKPTQQQLDDLASKGLLAGDASDYLSGKLKLTTGDVQQLVTDGLIPSQQGISDLTTGIENSPIYKGGMATAAQTTAGKISTLKDNLGQAIQTMSQPIFEKFSSLVGKIGDAMSKPAFQQFAKTVGQDIKTAVDTTTTSIENIVNWTIQWHDPILAAAGAITAFFLPAIISSGVSAVTSGTQITFNFVSGIIKSGVEAITSTASMWGMVGSYIAAGTSAVISGAQIAASFVASIIASGTQAVLSGAEITASFIASLIQTGIEAATTGGIMLASLIPAIVSVAAEGIVAAATAIPGLIAGFIAWAASAGAAAIATIAATWPILAVVAAVAALIAIIVLIALNWDTIWNAIKATAQNVIGAVSGWVSGLWSDLQKWFGDGLAWIQDKWNGLWNGLGSIASNAWNSVKGVLKDGINGAIDLLNHLIDAADKIPGVNIPHINHVNFAAGGVAPGGMAIVGEHGPEPIFLPRGTRVVSHEEALAALAGAGNQRGGNTYVVNLTTLYGDEQALTQGLVQTFKRQELLHR